MTCSLLQTQTDVRFYTEAEYPMNTCSSYFFSTKETVESDIKRKFVMFLVSKLPTTSLPSATITITSVIFFKASSQFFLIWCDEQLFSPLGRWNQHGIVAMCPLRSDIFTLQSHQPKIFEKEDESWLEDLCMFLVHTEEKG